MTIASWHAQALNQDPESANEIHGDNLAQEYGFKGGLVPGVTISAYLMHPAIVAWGMDFLNHGFAHVRVSSPLYDGEQFDVAITEQTESTYSAVLTGSDATARAHARVELMDNAGTAPRMRGDQVVAADYAGPKATRAALQTLMTEGCKALRYHWGPPHLMRYYLRDEQQMPELLRGPTAFANMSFILGVSNFLAASNFTMNPWVHLETTSQNYKAIAHDTEIIAEIRLCELFEKRGHEFFDARVELFDAADECCLSALDLRAIYQLRGS